VREKFLAHFFGFFFSLFFLATLLSILIRSRSTALASILGPGQSKFLHGLGRVPILRFEIVVRVAIVLAAQTGGFVPLHLANFQGYYILNMKFEIKELYNYL
jgi:hypothetical protein